jgi:N4-(beta-N-acetylglucosaminyl)-L-asparaginase
MATPISRNGGGFSARPPLSSPYAATPSSFSASPTYAQLPPTNGGDADSALADELAGGGDFGELSGGGGGGGGGGGADGGGGGACATCERLPPWARIGLLAALVASVLGAFVGLLFGSGAGGAGDGGGPAVARTRPVAVNTWFETTTSTAFGLLANGSSALDAAELGCQACEDARCDGTVGWGGSPDSTGETTLDALIMDGSSMDVGAVGDLRRVRHAIAAARKVLHYTTHTLLAGEAATNFSVMMGLAEQDLHSQESVWAFGNWTAQACQPNFVQNVLSGNSSCPPWTPIPTPSYTPVARAAAVKVAGAAAGAAVAPGAAAPSGRSRPVPASERDHDTVGLCTLDLAGNLAVGVSSNGANHKVAGRIGDAPIVGAGGYASNEAGCAAATGDGDITMRFLPAYQAVENMRRGMAPAEACADAVRRIAKFYAVFELGLVCLGADGEIGAASHGWTFTFCSASPDSAGQAVCTKVPPMASSSGGWLESWRRAVASALRSAANAMLR